MSVIVGLSSNGMPATDRSAVAQLVQPVSGGEGVGAGGVGPQQRFGWLTQGSWGGGQLGPPLCILRYPYFFHPFLDPLCW